MAPGRVPRAVTTRRLRTTRSGRNTLKADEIQFNLLVPLLARPHIERRRSDLINERNGEAESSEVDALEVATTTLAGVNPHVLEWRRLEVPELSLVLLAAVRARDAPERPGRQTARTKQLPAAAIARRRARRLEK